MFWRVLGIGGVIEMPMPIAEDGGDIWSRAHTGCYLLMVRWEMLVLILCCFVALLSRSRSLLLLHDGAVME